MNKEDLVSTEDKKPWGKTHGDSSLNPIVNQLNYTWLFSTCKDILPMQKMNV